MKKMTTTSKWVCILGGLILLFGGAAIAEVERTEIAATDGWPANSYLDLGRIRCSTGDLIWLNEVTPACSDGGKVHLRRALAYSCFQAASVEGTPEPRFTGVASFGFNGDFRADYTGAVWGTWRLVPSATCDAALLDDPEVYWEGTWKGRRAMACSDGECKWIGALYVVGRGHGGSIDRQRFKGIESVETFTPLPLPHELLGICSDSAPCPAEGHVMGTIRKR